MSVCTVAGPCQWMTASIASQTVVLIGKRPVTQNGIRLGACYHCGEPLDEATVADWPWKALRAAGAAATEG